MNRTETNELLYKLESQVKKDSKNTLKCIDMKEYGYNCIVTYSEGNTISWGRPYRKIYERKRANWEELLITRFIYGRGS